MDVESQPLAGLGPRSDSFADSQRTQADRQVGPLQVELPASDGRRAEYTKTGFIRRTWRGAELWLKVGLISSLSAAVAMGLLLMAVLLSSPVSTPVRFFVIGDWGRQGSANQTAVAQLMGLVAARVRPHFVVSTGDNFYPNSLASPNDALFQQSFMDVYTAESLQIPWHAVLGNHDYGDGLGYCHGDGQTPCPRSPMHQLGVELMHRDARWHCERSYTETFADGRVQLFFIDTNPFIAMYRDTDWARYDGGILQQSWEVQLREIERRLADSRAQWKLLVGHHPPRSNGHHGNNSELMEALEPLMAKYKVQAYFSGHDHNLEHLHVEEVGTHYFVSGGGSDTDGQRDFLGTASSVFQYRYSGFAAVHVSPKGAVVEFYAPEHQLKPVHTARI